VQPFRVVEPFKLGSLFYAYGQATGRRPYDVVFVDMGGLEEGLDVADVVACEILHLPCGSDDGSHAVWSRGASTQVENSRLNVLDLDETSSSLLERMLAVQDCMVPGMLSSDRVQVLHRTSAFDDPTQCISGPVSAPSGFRETTNSHHSAQLYRVLAERFYDVAACAKHGKALAPYRRRPNT